MMATMSRITSMPGGGLTPDQVMRKPVPRDVAAVPAPSAATTACVTRMTVTHPLEIDMETPEPLLLPCSTVEQPESVGVVATLGHT